MLIKSDILLLFITFFILANFQTISYPLYAQSCSSESTTRTCNQDGNVTQYLLNIKKGGTNVLSTSDYEQNFFQCEQYTFDCGYVQNDKEKISIANGIQLDMPATDIDSYLPSNPTLAADIKNYVNLTAEQGKCGMKVFPLMLTPTDSDQFFTNYMAKQITNIKNKYLTEKKNGTKNWADINVNIKTALNMILKQNKAQFYSSSTFWKAFTENNFIGMSDYLKKQFLNSGNKTLTYLHSAYLIDSVTKKCNKLQSINFLVDQSGSITPPAFQLALDFLTSYVNQMQDDPKLMSIHFYDATFQPYLGYNNTKAQLLSGIASKPYRALGTNTGVAINQTVNQITAANFDKGLNKVLVVMTDGFSYDDVLYASNYARSKDITVISVGIGPNVNDNQLLQMAQTPSNIIKASSYSDLQKLIDFISNYFCKQIIDLKLNQTIVNNFVRVPQSPAYFRIQKSNTNQYYELTINYQQDPQQKNQALYSSQYDPFPDQFTQFTIRQSYRSSITQKIYFIQPIQSVPVRVKKQFYQNQTIKNSYVSVGGTDIKFNISLLPCKNLNCSEERKIYSEIGKQKDPIINNGDDYIYAAIAGSVAALACASVMGIFTLRKIFGAEEEIPDQMNPIKPQNTQQDINVNDDFNQNNSFQSDKLRKAQGSSANNNNKDKNGKKCNSKDKKGGKQSNSKDKSQIKAVSQNSSNRQNLD